jgi:chromosome partitioning protein
MSKAIKIATMAPKGGVGKTTSTFCLAACLTRLGQKVLCIDLDPQGDLSDATGFSLNESMPTIGNILNAPRREQPALLVQAITRSTQWTDLVTAGSLLESMEREIEKGIAPEVRLRDSLSQAEELYDFILFDTPKGDGLLSKNALIACDAVLVPFQTEPFALKNFPVLLNKVYEVADRMNPDLYICAVLPSRMKRNNLSAQVLSSLKEWDSQPYSYRQSEKVWISPPVSDLTLYTELSAMKVPIYEHPDLQPKHIQPFELLAEELIRQRNRRKD